MINSELRKHIMSLMSVNALRAGVGNWRAGGCVPLLPTDASSFTWWGSQL